ncbi:TPA: recombination protein NinG [Pasteurella multocida]|nr:recombination protein NinG [Pasteurella multocida]
MTKKPKVHRCKVCGNYFVKNKSTQKVCSVDCAIKISKEEARKKREKIQRSERLATKKRMTALKEKNKTHNELIKDAQEAVNKYIRARDVNQCCISCGTPLIAEQLGGGFDAGHYRSRGSAPHLRFYTLNIHGQCKKCNRYHGGNYHQFRIGLIERLGVEKVEQIEADQRPRHYSKDDLRRIKKIFNKKARMLEKRKGL